MTLVQVLLRWEDCLLEMHRCQVEAVRDGHAHWIMGDGGFIFVWNE